MQRKIIESARWKLALGLAGSLAFTAVGVWLIGDAKSDESLMPWLCMLFFGFCALAFLLQLLRPQRLVLDADGFQVEGGVKPGKKVAWGEVEAFFAWRLPKGGTMAAWRLREEARPRTAPVGNFGRGPGVDGVLPRTLALGTKALLAEMEAWRTRAATSDAVAPPVPVE
ncbi:MAG: STM3941 family protein [Caulobacter sp.]